VAANQLRINGLEELRRALLALPAELVREAGVIVHAQAEAAAREMAAAYPVKTGALRNGLRVELGGDHVSAMAKVRNHARHAYFFEHGTKERFDKGRSRGRMPEGKVFIPIAMQRRRIMLAAMIDLVERSGLHVSGAAG
jgi:Bacteriophage HK97-gp10, putative tail-component